MKKLLLATSILAGTASIAAAEITLSGDARMGFLNNTVFDGLVQDDDTGFTSRARVKFTFSGETDGGLSFGASFRADNSSAASSGKAGEVFLSGAFGKIAMGDVDGAALAAVGHVDGVGLTGLGDRNESAYIANGGLDDDDLNDFEILTANSLTGDPSVLYSYTMGNFGLFASVTDPGFDTTILGDDPATVPVEASVAADGIAWALGANYTTDAYKFSIGYEDLQVDEIGGPAGFDADHLTLGADATFGAFTGKVRWGQGELNAFEGTVGGRDLDVDFDQWSVSGTYSADALAVTAFYANKQFDFSSATLAVGFDDDNVTDLDSYGIGASYDLGGGASLVGGIVDVERGLGDGSSASDTAYDLGVSFSF